MNAEPPERVGLGGLGERGLIRRIRRSAAATGAAPGVDVGIGDDTAVLAVPAGHKLLATTDLLIEDVHFRRISAAPSDIGWKAPAVNLLTSRPWAASRAGRWWRWPCRRHGRRGGDAFYAWRSRRRTA
jgi:hypothetical protein